MTIDDTDQAGGSKPPGRTPAYASFNSTLSLLDKLKENGCPQRFDRSYFGNASGGLIAQTRGTLRFFDLIDDEYRPTDLLHRVVEADPDQRKLLLRELAEDRYSEEIKLGQQRGTYGQLTAVLRERGLTGATARKAIAFYLHLAEYTELPSSPFFAQGRTATNGNAAAPTRKARRRRPDQAEPAPTTTQPSTSKESQRAQYVQLLMRMVEQSSENANGVPSELLDRIERALEFNGPDKIEGG